MLVSFTYHFRNSLIEKIDPRARWITSMLIMACVVTLWDVSLLVFFFGLSLLQVLLSRVTWKETRRAWLFMFLLVSMMIIVNILIARGGTQSSQYIDGRPLWTLDGKFPLFGWPIHYQMTTGRLWYGLTQFVRIMSISSLFIIIPFTMDPMTYGATFQGLGQKVAFAFDLALRFVPTLARDFRVTLDAQRARGYEVDKVEGGLFKQIRKTAPLFIPVTMNAILTGEDITNAMDLRCFGLHKRTWIKVLPYHWWDYALMSTAALLFVASLLLRHVFHLADFWLPASLY